MSDRRPTSSDHRRAHRRIRALGFTLIEVFIATAILGIGIIYMFDALTHSPDRSNRAKLVSVATMLARTKMIDIEADLLKDGWEEFDDEECGDFKEEEYGNLSRFRWCARIEKIELPDNVNVEGAIGKMLGLGDPDDPDAQPNPNQPGGGILGMWMGGGALGGMGGSGSSSGQQDPMMSGLASVLTSFLSPFRNVVEQAIRRVTLRVFWSYRGQEQSVTLIYYVTRPELVEQAIIGGFMQGMGTGTPGTPGTPGSSSTGAKTR